MADAGFDEILEESGLYNRNQINGILSGKHYTRSVVAHKQFSEAVYRLYWDFFKCWIENESCKFPPLKRYLVTSKNPLKGSLSWLQLISSPKILAIVPEFLLGKDRGVQELFAVRETTYKLRSYEFHKRICQHLFQLKYFSLRNA